MFKLEAPVGHTTSQFPQPTQFCALNMTTGFNSCDSGLQHHLQRRGQPFKKAIVLTPGPSFTENLCILKTSPFLLVSQLGSILLIGTSSRLFQKFIILETLFCTSNDIVLNFLSKYCPVSGVTSYTYY